MTKRKRYYVTIEIEADVDKEESVDGQRLDLFIFVQKGLQRHREMNMYVQHSEILSYIDEKGNVL